MNASNTNDWMIINHLIIFYSVSFIRQARAKGHANPSWTGFQGSSLTSALPGGIELHFIPLRIPDADASTEKGSRILE